MTPFFKPILGFLAALMVGCLAMVATGHAAVITLGPADCGIVKQCVDVPNDAAAAVSIYGAPGYPWFYVYLGGVEYKAGVASGYGGDNVLLTDSNGDVLYLTYAFSTYVTCVRSGRGQHCSTHWVLTNGATVTQ